MAVELNKPVILKDNSLIIVDRLLSDLNRDKTLITDRFLIKRQLQYISDLEHLKTVVKLDPRFPYQIIQDQIDYLFRTDNPLTIFKVSISLEWLINNKLLKPTVYGF